MSFVDIFKTCPPIMFLCSPYDGIYWPQDLYAGICEGKYLPLTHFMPRPGLIVNTFQCRDFYLPLGEKRGGEDREFRLRSSLMHALPRHDFRFMVSASHVFYALVLIF